MGWEWEDRREGEGERKRHGKERLRRETEGVCGGGGERQTGRQKGRQALEAAGDAAAARGRLFFV